jgi:hypothetical protein
MSLGKQLDDATTRLHEAAYRIDEARAKATSVESLREWLSALTEYATALGDVQLLNNESTHEKLHSLAEQTKAKL